MTHQDNTATAGGDQSRDNHSTAETQAGPATLTAGPDGALWGTVDGADVQQLAARISAVCDVLIPAQRTRPAQRPPMTQEQINTVAAIFRRIDARRDG